MPKPNPNAQPPAGDGKDGGQTDPYEALKGQLDEKGIPKHPQEQADFYRDKFANSTQGVSDLVEKNKSLSEENAKLKTTPAPPQGNAPNTANDLSSKIPNWNLLSPEQQSAMLNSYGSLHKDLNTVKDQVAKMVDTQDFEQKFSALTLQPEFAGLIKLKDEFTVSAYKDEDSRRTPFKTFAIAFLAEKKLWGKPADGKPPVAPAPNDAGRTGLDGNVGGDQTPPAVPNTYTSEEAETLRKTDPKKYNRLIAEKKLNLKD